MLLLGVILALVGYFVAIPIVMWIGVALILVGAVLLLLGRTGRPVGGRTNWY